MSGIYIHVPFCKQKCSYCDFHFSTTFEKYREDMLLALNQELKIRNIYLKHAEINTIYFGGGTPSLLKPIELKTLLDTIFEIYQVNSDAEITLECNPDDCTSENLSVWKKLGVNRLSIGLQSFQDEDLKWMNRAHTAPQSIQCVKQAQIAGFDNITIDLIYGTPNLSAEVWKEQLTKAINLGVKHISAYCLTVEKRTALDHYVKSGKIVISNEDEQSDQYQLLVRTLKEKGFVQYEISNFALKGYESKHNSSYWKGKHYLGIGPSAHSFNGVSRTWNIANNTKYISGILSGRPNSEQEVLSAADQFNEYLLTGFRTIYGVKIEHLKNLHPMTHDFENQLQNFKSKNLIFEDEGRLYLTENGRLIADHIASSLFIITSD